MTLKANNTHSAAIVNSNKPDICLPMFPISGIVNDLSLNQAGETKMFVQNDGPTYSFFCLWGCHDQGYRTHELARDAFIEHECRSMRGQ